MGPRQSVSLQERLSAARFDDGKTGDHKGRPYGGKRAAEGVGPYKRTTGGR